MPPSPHSSFPSRPLPLLAFAATLTVASCMDPSEPGALVPATVVQDASLPSLQLPETRVHAETFGDDELPIVIVLHGGPGNDYRYMLRLVEPLGGPSLADDFRFVFWDQRGAGLSQRHDRSELTLAAYLRDLEALVDLVAPDRKVVLLSHSWGGQYAAMFINAHPERVAGAVFAEPGQMRWDIPQVTPDFDFDYTAEYLGDYAWGRQFISLTDHARADYYTSLLLLEPTNGRVEEPSPNWRVGSAVLLSLYLEELSETKYDFTDRLAELAAPVLFIVGERSHDLGAKFQMQQLGFFAQPELVEIADAGHSDVVYANAASSVPLIRDYLTRIAAATPGGRW